MNEQTKYFWNTKTGKIVLIAAGIFICVCWITASFLFPSNKEPSLSKEDIQSTANALAFTTVAQTQIAAFTITPSLTLAPTKTPLPTATNTPPPEPIILTGSGDSIVDVSKWKGPAIMHAKYGSGGNFAVINYGPNNERIDLLINTIGAYDGIVQVDFLDNEDTSRLEVSAEGPWEFTILPLTAARAFDIPSTITGVGDEVIVLRGGNADVIKADNSQGDGNFAIWAYGTSGTRDLIFNEIAPYTGSALLASDTFVLTITATNGWSLEITTR